jgi:hypothetical protein
MRKYFGAFACLLTAAWLASAAGAWATPSDMSSLDGTFWQIKTLGPAPNPQAATLSIWASSTDQGGIVVARRDCVRNYEWRRDSGALTIIQPRGHCDNGALEAALDHVLTGVTSVTVSGSRLTLIDGAGRPVAVLRRRAPAGLEFQHWVVVGYFDGHEIKGVPAYERLDAMGSPCCDMIDGPAPDLAFAEGWMWGRLQCGPGDGEYHSVQDRVLIQSSLFFGLGCCCNPDDDAEVGIRVGLNGERWIVRDGNRLLLKDAKHQTRIVLAPMAPTRLEEGRWRIVRYRSQAPEDLARVRHGSNDSALVAPDPDLPFYFANSGFDAWLVFPDSKARHTQSSPWLSFSGGKIQGGPLCGWQSATYSLADNKITAKIEPLSFIGGFCLADISTFSSAVANALTHAERVEHMGDRILLRGAKNRVEVELAR